MIEIGGLMCGKSLNQPKAGKMTGDSYQLKVSKGNFKIAISWCKYYYITWREDKKIRVITKRD